MKLFAAVTWPDILARHTAKTSTFVKILEIDLMVNAPSSLQQHYKPTNPKKPSYNFQSTASMAPHPPPSPLAAQFAKLALESYSQNHGKSGHSAIYLQHLRMTVADACEAKISIQELEQQLAAAELAGIERRELKALASVVKDMERMGIGFDKLREVREDLMLRGRHGDMEGREGDGEEGSEGSEGRGR